MKFTLSWLKDHLDTEADALTVAETLTRIGLEVEGVHNPAEALRPFRVARVITAERHPQADKLQVLTVDSGDGEALQVVCGAPNARAGLVGVFGGPGTYVPGSDFTLKKAAIRGVESNGMMCSARELQLGEDHDGIIELPADAPVGASFADFAGLDDAVFDVAITPNRQDCMGVRGIARDLAAAGLGKLKPLNIPAIEGSFDNPVEIRIDDPEGCPAFYGRTVRGLTNGASPDWMQQRLKAAGQRPISALVDITNYVMLDVGRPAHAYDLRELRGAVSARRAKDGEKVLALNEKEYELDGTMTVIADDAQVHDIGGIMGGEHSGVSETTTETLLEIAYFTPDNIARTGQKLQLTSDARSRFERGVDPAFLDDGLAILTGHILDICGGEASRLTRAGEPPVEPRRVRFDPNRTAALGGIEVPVDEQQKILERLGFRIEGSDAIVPSWRRDIEGTADLVEEVTRIIGYDAIPAAPLPRAEGVARPTATRSQMIERRVRRAAAARGLDEAVTWSFIGAEEAALFGGAPHVLANPISEEMKHMRPSLMPGLATAVRRNADRGATSIRLFEVGRRYLADAERPTVGILLAGDRTPRNWQDGKARGFDPFDAKAEVLALLDAAGAPTANLQLTMGAGETWHPGRSATLGLGKNILAAFGELHPRVAKALDLPTGTVAAEIYLDAIPASRATERARTAYSPPLLQAITRDFAFMVPADLAADNLVRAIRGADKALITCARLFDRYEGEQGLSLAVEITLQPGEKSFTDAEITEVSKKVVAAAEKLGASLRS
ncbi:phenylalanine--tRNA ligase subunit beta [Sphingomonas sp. NSE70-1]|uniref:Phenylalanine--tRNA ligase beta subunit n=1 Tax=Sphingomonas caseinilyticus TaxID=2908205 RepID=A0ABT0RV81_9SPHN|nr:phenylalanine--tRNA ligase subunit beta [Sphingomonas caseinilyticus]MCL6698826.1 phenylalanine--tRNA ligase subunit beta [Sphingomonas caseinilyticus]